MNIRTQQESDAIEAIIDRIGMAQLAEAITDIAASKAEHVRTNWPDSPALARTWTRIARRFDRMVPALELCDDILGFGRKR